MKAAAAEAQAETLALLETLLESAPVGFAFVDRDFRFARVNDALAEMNGLPAAEHLGRRVSEIVPELWPQLHALYQGVLGSGEAVRGLEIAGATDAQPGVQRHWVVSFYPVQAQHGGEVLGVGVVASEVTESVQLEAHLRQSQKLEAVGLLAGGVAHDFDNALAAIILTAELAQRKPAIGEVDDHLDSILKVARSANRLTRQLLLFSRQEPVRSTVVDVLSRIEEVVTFLDAGLGEHIRLELDLQPVPYVRMDPGQLDQVLVNLAINARDAMSGGGTLSVVTRDVTITDPPLGLSPGRYVDLQVRGHGPGHDPGGPRACLRAVLHHQDRPGRDRSRAGHRLRHGPERPRPREHRVDRGRRDPCPGPASRDPRPPGRACDGRGAALRSGAASARRRGPGGPARKRRPGAHGRRLPRDERHRRRRPGR